MSHVASTGHMVRNSYVWKNGFFPENMQKLLVQAFCCQMCKAVNLVKMLGMIARMQVSSALCTMENNHQPIFIQYFLQCALCSDVTQNAFGFLTLETEVQLFLFQLNMCFVIKSSLSRLQETTNPVRVCKHQGTKMCLQLFSRKEILAWTFP